MSFGPINWNLKGFWSRFTVAQFYIPDLLLLIALYGIRVGPKRMLIFRMNNLQWNRAMKQSEVLRFQPTRPDWYWHSRLDEMEKFRYVTTRIELAQFLQ